MATNPQKVTPVSPAKPAKPAPTPQPTLTLEQRVAALERVNGTQSQKITELNKALTDQGILLASQQDFIQLLAVEVSSLKNALQAAAIPQADSFRAIAISPSNTLLPFANNPTDTNADDHVSFEEAHNFGKSELKRKGWLNHMVAILPVWKG